jgi:hypothetical protein
MNLAMTVEIRAGGAGSGCNPAAGHCGRPKFVYHGTTVENAKKILRTGLKPSKNMLGENGVSTTESVRTALNYAYNLAKGKKPNEVAVVVVHNHPKSGLEKAGARGGAGHWFSKGAVDRKYVKGVHIYKSMERAYPDPMVDRVMK